MGIMDALKGMFGGGGGAPEQPEAPPIAEGQQQEPESPTPEVLGDAPKLTDAQKKNWQERLEEAERDHKPYWEMADMLKEEYLGPEDPMFKMEKPNRKGKPVNLISSYVNTSAPQIIPQNPWPMVEQRRPGDEFHEGAARLEARLRDVFDRVDTYNNLRRCVFDAFFLAGFALSGWQPNTSRIVRNLKSDAKDKGVKDYGTPTQVGRAASDRGFEGRPDEPYIRHIPYRNIRIGKAVSFGAAPWIGYVVEKSMEDLLAADEKNGGIYHDTDKVKANAGGREGQPIEQVRDLDKGAKVFTIFHQGRRQGEIGVLVLAGSSYTEIRHVWVKMGTEGYPIRMVSFHEITRIFPASPLQFWMDLNDSFNEFVAEMTERASQHKRVTFVPDEATRDALVHSSSGDVIVSRESRDVNQVEVGGTNPDTWAAMQVFERMVDKVSGLSDTRRGIQGGGEQTATQTMLMARYSQTRLDDYAGSFTRFLCELCRDVAGLLLTHQWQDVPVTIQEGPQDVRYATFSNREVPGPADAYSYDFDVTESQSVNPAIRQKRAQDLLALLGDPNIQNYAAREGKMISVTAAVEDLIEANGVRDVKRYVKPMPTPEQQAQEQSARAIQETQAMSQSGQVLPVSPNDAHHVHIPVHSQADDPANAEHMGEHFGYLEAMDGRLGGAARAGAASGGIAEAPPLHEGPARATPTGLQAQGVAQLSGETNNVG